MSFVYPAFLFGLFAVAIPILVHLFNFRRFKKIYFTNVRFLKEIKQDTRNRSRLKHLLILAARILAVIFLVLAFAQPYIPAKGTKMTAGAKKVSVYVDNSFSMDAISSNGDLLEVAKRRAREIASGYQSSDLFQLLTNDFSGRSQRLMNRDEFLEQVDAVRPGAASRTISEVLTRQQDALDAGAPAPGNKFRYLLSDFQKSIADITSIKPDSDRTTYFIPIESSKQGNVFIDTCYFTQPFVQIQTPNELVIRIKNSGEEPAENVPVSLSVNGIQRSVTSVNVDAQGTTEARLSFTLNEGGWLQAEVSLTDYPVIFDDHYFLSFHVRQNLQVLCINEQAPNAYLDALFTGDPYFQLKNTGVNQVDYSSFGAQQLIVLNGIRAVSTGMAAELTKYVSRGGSLVVFPGAEPDLDSYRSFLSACNSSYFTSLVTAEEKVTRLETNHPLLYNIFENKKSIPENMDLPVVHQYFPLSHSVSQPVMTLAGGNSLLTATDFGRGHLYVFAVPLDEEFSSLPHHALFVPILLKSALRASSEIGIPLTIGRDRDLAITDTLLSGDQVFHLRNEKMKFDVVPESRILENSTVVSVHDQVNEAGNYELMSGNKVIALASFNYDRKESDLTCYSSEELQAALEKSNNPSLTMIEPTRADLSHTLSQLAGGRKYWKHCIVAVLLFLAMETLLIRFMKTT